MHNFEIETLGEATTPNVIHVTNDKHFVNEQDRILLDNSVTSLDFYGLTHQFEEKDDGKQFKQSNFEKAGPRKNIFFSPDLTKVAIMTCGGICPGLNAVIRGLVKELWFRYGVKNIIGIKYGYQGLKMKDAIVSLDPDKVEDIHKLGGTVIGTSRGTATTVEILEGIVQQNVNMVFTIGGDGTMKGAYKIAEEIKKRNLKISVIGIPKTIDNDIPFVTRSFGFQTAIEKACVALSSAYEEARGHKNGIGLVKLMGRNAGFISASATLSMGNVDLCLIPEVSFSLTGKFGILDYIKNKLKEKNHMLIVVSEGAGQDLQEETGMVDKSGNKQFSNIGLLLKQKISSYLKEEKVPFDLKYIEPSYIIRSSDANCFDQAFCLRLAQNAVHAAMSGRTSMLIGYWGNNMTHVPFKSLQNFEKKIDPTSDLWFNVLETTMQKEVGGV